MKKLFALLMSAVILFSPLVTSFAKDGDTNIDGGGGGMGDGSGLDGGANANYWNPGNDGVRVTIVREKDQKQMTTPMDFTNISNINPLFFGYKSKLNYRKGAKLSPQIGNKYDYQIPASPIPPIISSNGSTNIAAVKRYFGQEGTLKDICAKTGFSFEELLTKKYVILLEPIAYFRFDGKLYAMTAHEAALYDKQVGGYLKSKMGNLTHQNLPLSMFLEHSDLGFPVYSGSTGGVKSNDVILSSLGLGTVRIGEQSCCNHPPNCPCLKPDGSCTCPEDHPGESCEESEKCKCPKNPQAETYDYVFRPDTDVITSVYYNPGQEVSPDQDYTSNQIEFFDGTPPKVKVEVDKNGNFIIVDGKSDKSEIDKITINGQDYKGRPILYLIAENIDITITVTDKIGSTSDEIVLDYDKDIKPPAPDNDNSGNSGNGSDSNHKNNEHKHFKSYDSWNKSYQFWWEQEQKIRELAENSDLLIRANGRIWMPVSTMELLYNQRPDVRLIIKWSSGSFIIEPNEALKPELGRVHYLLEKLDEEYNNNEAKK